jgi:hypothetical protein
LLCLASVGGDDADGPRPGVEPAVVGGIVSRIKQLVLAGEAKNLPQLRPELLQFALSFYGASTPGSSSARGDQDEPAQPQSPERSNVLEPA